MFWCCRISFSILTWTWSLSTIISFTNFFYSSLELFSLGFECLVLLYYGLLTHEQTFLELFNFFSTGTLLWCSAPGCANSVCPCPEAKLNPFSCDHHLASLAYQLTASIQSKWHYNVLAVNPGEVDQWVDVSLICANSLMSFMYIEEVTDDCSSLELVSKPTLCNNVGEAVQAYTEQERE